MRERADLVNRTPGRSLASIAASRRSRFRSRRRRHARLARLALVFLGVLAPTLAACGRVEVVHPLSVLPEISTPKAWRWVAACPHGPATTSGCQASGPKVGVGQLNGDQWNLGTGSTSVGSLDMSLDSAGALTVRGDLSSAPPCVESSCIAPAANTWVHGYPNVLYGINQCNASTSPPVSSRLRLPMEVDAIRSDLIGTTTYSAHTPGVTYDVAYDMWLSRSDTKSPCQTNGTLEVMVWTDYNELALLPASLKVATITVPYSVNGTVRPGNQEWSIYVTNVYGGGQTEPWGGTVWAVLDKGSVVRSGTVSVDLSLSCPRSVRSSKAITAGRDFRKDYWLDTIPFGLEYGPGSGSVTGAGSSYFSLRLSSYCLNVGSTLRRHLWVVRSYRRLSRRCCSSRT